MYIYVIRRCMKCNKLYNINYQHIPNPRHIHHTHGSMIHHGPGPTTPSHIFSRLGLVHQFRPNYLPLTSIKGISNIAQGKSDGLITRRSLDRDQVLL